MTKASVSHITITKVSGTESKETADLLAAEEPLEIRIGYGPQNSREQKSISVTMRTPALILN
jgi:FdhD protein